MAKINLKATMILNSSKRSYPCDCKWCEQGYWTKEEQLNESVNKSISWCPRCRRHYVDDCPSCEARAEARFERKREGE